MSPFHKIGGGVFVFFCLGILFWTLPISEPIAKTANEHSNQVALKVQGASLMAVETDSGHLVKWSVDQQRFDRVSEMSDPVMGLLRRQDDTTWMTLAGALEDKETDLVIQLKTGEMKHRIRLPLARADQMIGQQGKWIFVRSGEVDERQRNRIGVLDADKYQFDRILLIPGVIQSWGMMEDGVAIVLSIDPIDGIRSLWNVSITGEAIKLLEEENGRSFAGMVLDPINRCVYLAEQSMDQQEINYALDIKRFDYHEGLLKSEKRIWTGKGTYQAMAFLQEKQVLSIVLGNTGNENELQSELRVIDPSGAASHVGMVPSDATQLVSFENKLLIGSDQSQWLQFIDFDIEERIHSIFLQEPIWVE